MRYIPTPQIFSVVLKKMCWELLCCCTCFPFFVQSFCLWLFSLCCCKYY